MQSKSRALSAVLTSIIISGCASSLPPPNSRIDVSLLDVGVKPVIVEDATMAYELPATASSPRRFMSPSFDPPLVEILARRLALEKISQSPDHKITIVAAHVDAYVQSDYRSPPPSIYNPRVSLGVNVAVDVLALGVFALLSRSDRVSIIAKYDVRIGDYSYSAQGGTAVAPKKVEEGMVIALREAIDGVVARINAKTGAYIHEPLTEPPSIKE